MSTATACHHASSPTQSAADSRYDNGYEAARQKIWSGDFGALKTIVMVRNFDGNLGRFDGYFAILWHI